MIGRNRFGNVPHIYGNFTHESNIVNAVDSFLDSISSICIGILLGGEEAALKAVLGVIVSGGEEHQSSRLRLVLSSPLEFELGAKSDKNFLKTCENGQGLGLTGTMDFLFGLEIDVGN